MSRTIDRDDLSTHHRTTKCRACRAPMVWAKTENDRSMPLDPLPVEGGNVVVLRDVGTTLIVKVLGEPSLLDEHASPTVRYVTHFATCPEAGKFRR